jgi:carbamoyltransferase
LTGHDLQQGSFLGPQFTPAEIDSSLSRLGASGRSFNDGTELFDHVASHLADGKIVGWFQGRMEFGPRALGARSILGDPRSATMQSAMNVKIKFRESFRPFAPAVLKERASEWFDLKETHESPYMLLVAPVLENHRVPIDPETRWTMCHDPDLRRRVNIVRTEVPAVSHVDYSARIQTVDEERNPRFHGLLQAFERLTGCPMLVNTSFNVRGEPIVCTPEDAYRCFIATDIDVLVLEDTVITKDGNVPQMSTEAREAHLARFQLD